jgi:Raf kinase inhibitor-like YbhB/YbcL family protein
MIAALSLVVAVSGMQLSSSDFPAGGSIPRANMATDCGGKNLTPELHWSAAPAGTKSFALIVRDPDAPIAGGFYHWVVYNIPASATSLKAGATLQDLGANTTGNAAYYGPCPPPGPAHHYIFTLYALDVPQVRADAPPSAAQLEQRMAGHVLARATLSAVAAH